ncbi:MAG: hypothetical protein WKF91_14500, partial [Segetibacter sp.]
MNRLKKCSKWYYLLFVLFALAKISLTPLHAQKSAKDKFEQKSLVGKQKDESYIVPTSQIIDPAGTTIIFPGRPMDLALNPDETILAVKNLTNIIFFNAVNQSIKQTLALPAGGNTFTGICWSDNGQKLWTTDTRGNLRSAKLQTSGLFAWDDEILLPLKVLSNGQFSWENEILDKSTRGADGRE